MNGDNRKASCAVACVVLALVAYTCRGGTAATPTVRTAATPESALREILNHGGLKLSMAGDSAGSRFHFTMRVTLPLRSGGECTTEYFIARDGTRSAVLVRAGNGRICSYMTSDLCVAADPKHPGAILVATVGQPVFRFAPNGSNDRADFGVGFNRTGAAPAILLDIGGLLAPPLAAAQAVHFDGNDDQTVVVRAPHSTVRVTLRHGTDRAAFPIEGYAIITDDARAASLAVTDVRVGTPDAGLFGISKADIEALGLPMRDLTEEDGRHVGLLAVPNFGEGPEREAVHKLGMLFATVHLNSKKDPPAPADDESSRQSTGAKPGKG